LLIKLPDLSSLVGFRDSSVDSSEVGGNSVISSGLWVKIHEKVHAIDLNEKYSVFIFIVFCVFISCVKFLSKAVKVLHHARLDRRDSHQ
jgi:hypothetical protein